MLLRLVFPNSARAALLPALAELGAGGGASSAAADGAEEGEAQLTLLEGDDAEESAAPPPAAAPAAPPTPAAAPSDGVAGGAAVDGSSGSVRCLADPSIYRPLSELLAAHGGTVLVIELKA
eukprot:6696337-Prymnesium_polylepis.1